MSSRILGIVAIAGLSGPLLAASLPEVPVGREFVRSIDLDTRVQSIDPRHTGAQSARIRTRYLDPDVNAFVGLLFGAHRFNEKLHVGKSGNANASNVLWNWGGAFGLVRGRHLWELDLMGAAFSQRLGPAVALAGEHRLARQWTLYHRAELMIFTNDTIVDADQGLCWMAGPVGIAAGFRIFALQYHHPHNGPHIGLRLLFPNPKIPFWFPSLG